MLPKAPRIPPQSVKRIEIAAFDGAQLLDVTAPLQVFATANEICRKSGGEPPYEIEVVAPTLVVTTTSGLPIMAKPLPESHCPIDTLVVAGGQGVLIAAQDPRLVEWVLQRNTEARRVASVCTGAFILGAAGLLDERRAVTHWEHCDALARRFPKVKIDPDPIFIRDGPIWTSAGVTAGIDLALALVEEDLGRATALAVARHLVVFLKRPGGQAQFSSTLSLQSEDDHFGDLDDWTRGHLGDDLSLERLAVQAGMSERTFSRKYLQERGITPSRGVEILRVEAARNLLIETKLSIKRIAVKCGFGTEETMRRTFLRVQGCGPKDYRDRFS